MNASTDTTAAPPGARSMRADARRNRDSVVLAARKLMADQGLDAQMDEVAKLAGVGVGTVYRHFPTKDHLIVALAEYRFERLAEFARECLAADDPGPAFERFIFRAGELQAADRALSEVMRDHAGAMEAGAVKSNLLELTREAMTRAQEAGHIRPDAMAEDVPMLMCGMSTATPGCSGPFISPTSWRRYLGIALDGLRTDAARSELPPR